MTFPDARAGGLLAPRAQPAPDRVLATVLFTDLVGSTEKAVTLGDKAWRDLLSRQREAVRAQLRRFRGEEMDTAGDRLFAPTTTYDLVWDKRRYPPKAILGTAHEFATGQRLASCDFEGGKTGAVKVLGKLGFTVQPRRPAT